MNDDSLNEYPGLIDDDPTLDFILYKEMEKEEKQQQKPNQGCLGLLLLVSLPAGIGWCLSRLLVG